MYINLNWKSSDQTPLNNKETQIPKKVDEVPKHRQKNHMEETHYKEKYNKAQVQSMSIQLGKYSPLSLDNKI